MLKQITESTSLMEFFRQLLSGAPVVNGKHVTCTFAVADGTTKTFSHGLGRMPQGQIIVESTDPTATVATVGACDVTSVGIALTVAADVTLKVWVY